MKDAMIDGDIEAAAIAQECVTLSRSMGLVVMALRGIVNWGYALLGQGQFEEAIERAREGIALSEQQGESWERGILFQLLAGAAFGRGAIDEAAGYARQALVFEHSLDDRTGGAHTLDLLASIEMQRGAPELAATLQGASEALFRSIPSSLRSFRFCGFFSPVQI